MRVTPLREGLVVAPADGRVSRVVNAAPPPEMGLGDRPLPRISIFMSVFDCHVNRSPIAGKIERMVYHPGKFLNADLDKASEDNERNAFVITGTRSRIGVVQIAGLIARRIVPFVQEGQTITAGDRIGMIRFGSRVDVYLPEGGRALVRLATGELIDATAVNVTQTGQQTLVSIRPERVEFKPEMMPQGAHTIDAEVRDVIYMGDILRARMKVAGSDEFVMKFRNTQGQVRLSPGQKIRVGCG